MRKLLFLCCTLFSLLTLAQQKGFHYETTDIQVARSAVIDFSEKITGYEPQLILLKPEKPSPLSEFKLLKNKLDEARRARLSKSDKHEQRFNKTGSPAPELMTNFDGNLTQGTPNDNDLAVSNGGKIISVVNTNLNLFNDTGTFISGKTLDVFANKLGKLDRTYDPRVIYDPEKDRFILVFLQGSTSTDTRIIVAFSQTNDPAQKWNFYVIPGNIFGDSSWSDYPIISLTQSELFITVNRLKDNTSFQLGFIESLIWQVDKQKGYDGDTLEQRSYKNIKYNGKSIWSICPAKGGEHLYGPNMFFISMRPADLSNDTVFLHEVTNTIASGTAQLKLTILKSNRTYGLPSNAIQPSGKKLQTNDARSLCAMYEQDRIHFVGNCIDTTNISPALYYGIIENASGTPVVKGRLITYDTMDIGYPSIAYAGGGGGDWSSSIIGFSYVSATRFPGTAAVFVDRFGEISPPVVVKAGLGSVNIIADTLQRWGDYTGNQRKYNEPGVCWINGSYGKANGGNFTWIGKLKSKDPLLGINRSQEQKIENTVVYPNPSRDFASIEFEIHEAMILQFDLLDMHGKLITGLLKVKANAGANKLSIATNDLPEGVYFINIIHENTILEHKKLLVVH